MRALLPLLLFALLGCGDKPASDSGDTVQGEQDVDGDGHSDDDCDDEDPDVWPGAEEACDGIDEDCDGAVDEEATDARSFYDDQDADGYGGAPTTACEPPPGHVEQGGDCDDGDDATWPGATEICDNRDNDCDASVDEEAADAATLYPDDDGDGYGDPTDASLRCPADGYVENAEDCDDTDAAAWPGAEEVCDGVDNDCDASTVEDGSALRVDDDGATTDLSSHLASGTSDAPLEYTMTSDGRLTICSGEWFVHLVLEADIDVIGPAGAAVTILSAGGAAPAVEVGADGLTVSLQGLTLRDGNHQSGGGGVRCAVDADVSLADLVIQDNRAEDGGGVYLQTCDAAISGTTISDNEAASSGGGLAMFGSAATIDGSVIERNTSGDAGGGAFLQDDEWGANALDVEDTLIQDNDSLYGGGLWIDGSTFTCTGSEATRAGFLRNAASDGGAIRIKNDNASDVQAVACDMGEGEDDNSSDVLIGTSTTYDYGDDATFSCDTTCAP